MSSEQFAQINSFTLRDSATDCTQLRTLHLLRFTILESIFFLKVSVFSLANNYVMLQLDIIDTIGYIYMYVALDFSFLPTQVYPPKNGHTKGQGTKLQVLTQVQVQIIVWKLTEPFVSTGSSTPRNR